MCQPGLTQTAGKTESRGPRICWETWVKASRLCPACFPVPGREASPRPHLAGSRGLGWGDLKTLTHLWGRWAHPPAGSASRAFYTCQRLEMGRETWGLRGSRGWGGGGWRQRWTTELEPHKAAGIARSPLKGSSSSAHLLCPGQATSAPDQRCQPVGSGLCWGKEQTC